MLKVVVGVAGVVAGAGTGAGAAAGAACGAIVTIGKAIMPPVVWLLAVLDEDVVVLLALVFGSIAFGTSSICI